MASDTGKTNETYIKKEISENSKNILKERYNRDSRSCAKDGAIDSIYPSGCDIYGDLPEPSAEIKNVVGEAPKGKRKDQEEDKSLIVSSELPLKKAKVLDLPQTLTIISKHLKSEKKFMKAASLLSRLVETQLTSDNSAIFYEFFYELMNRNNQVNESKTSKGYKMIFESVRSKLDCFINNRYTIESYILQAVLCNNLFVDDSYLFSKAVQEIKPYFQSTPTDFSEESVYRRNTNFICLDSLLTMYKFPWAKVPIESSIRIFTLKRLEYQGKDREKIDSLTSTITAKRVAPDRLTCTSRAADARRNVTEKREGGTRGAIPGILNHPLHNINQGTENP